MTRGVAKRFAKYCSDEVCSQSEAMAKLEALSRGTLTRANSRVVAARVPLETAQRIVRFAAAHRVAPHVFLRQALALMTAAPVAPPDPEGILADLTKALGLPDYTSPGDVLNALEDLFAALGAPVDPLAASPDAPPAELSRAATTPTTKPDAFGFTKNSALAHPTTPAQQEQWVAGRAAQRAKRSNPLSSVQAARGEQARRR